VREADRERLTREILGTPQRHSRLRLTLALGTSHRIRARRLDHRTTMRPRAKQAAARLGLDETTIRWLEARGYLRRLPPTEAEIRARLYHARLAYLRSLADRRTRNERS
jgi:hypothetical protein